MTEESKNLTENKSEGVTEHTTEVKVDMSGMLKVIEELKAQNKMLSDKLDVVTAKIAEKQSPPVIPEAKPNQTKGIVAEEVKNMPKMDASLVVERAEFGKGFEIYRDVSKDVSAQFIRLAR